MSNKKSFLEYLMYPRPKLGTLHILFCLIKKEAYINFLSELLHFCKMQKKTYQIIIIIQILSLSIANNNFKDKI